MEPGQFMEHRGSREWIMRVEEGFSSSPEMGSEGNAEMTGLKLYAALEVRALQCASQDQGATVSVSHRARW